jgi:hypothetical protein
MVMRLKYKNLLESFIRYRPHEHLMTLSRLLFLTLLCVSCSCIQNQKDYASIPGSAIRTHNTLRIAMPSDWKEIAGGTMLTYLPPESDAADPTSEKVVVVVSFKTEEEASVPLRQLMDKGMSDARAVLPDLELTAVDENADLAGLDAIRFNYTASMQGRTVEYTQISARKGNVVYGIMHSCVKGACRHTDVYDDMISSFEPLDYSPPR